MNIDHEIRLSNPDIGEEEAKAAYDVVMSGWLGEGKKVKEFEKAFADYMGVKYAAACSNGTVALHMILLAYGIGPGDEVILPSLTFVSTATSLMYAGVKPIFAEIKKDTFNIDPGDIEKRITPRTKAVTVVHYGGQPADMDEIRKICGKHNLILIEDSAEAHGAEYKGRCAGSLGDVSVFSFTCTKIITTGEGGLILTNNKDIHDKIKLLRNHGQTAPYRHEILGYNYRFNDVQAAIGLEQLKKLDKIFKTKNENAKYLSEKLNKIKGIKTPYKAPDRTHPFMIYSVLLDEELISKRDTILKYLHDNKIQARAYFPPAHMQPVFAHLGYKEGDLPVTESVWKRIISLPFGVRITEEDMDYMCGILEESLR
ncbi:MAG: DegT/DnrJ/EryC1/StrS family aminotransferase [Armatimonadota bacterium]